MSIIEQLIMIPVFVGVLLLLMPKKVRPVKVVLALITSAYTLYEAILLYLNGLMGSQLIFISSTSHALFGTEHTLTDFDAYNLFWIDGLSQLIVLFVGIFTLLVVIYSIYYITKEKNVDGYYGYLLITLGASNGAALANHLLLFITFWGILALTLYKLIRTFDEESANAAIKSLILVGGSDVLMLFGIGLIWSVSDTLNMSQLTLGTSTAIGVWAFIFLLIGAFTKAGAFPFHTWIPEYTQKAPASSSAFLPASLDKLLGIYFLARLCNYIFILNEWLTFTIILIGVATIIIGVMMALIQHDYKKLLGYHAVSQVGYMVVGLGMGTVLGIIGGLFHMINNALYKNGLFLVAGNVEDRTGKSDLNDTGGLAGNMPVTFIAALVFALSISGVPPFNGFASKWIIYQGIIDFGKGAGLANSLWIVWLALAVIGSALTLASFIKFISGIFLGRRDPKFSKVKEVNAIRLAPVVLLALACIGFGVFASNYVVPYLFKFISSDIVYIGAWDSVTVSILVLVSIVLGVIIYALGDMRRFRREDSFIGGERLQDTLKYNVTEFYNTIRDYKPFSFIYRKADEKWFDIYYLSKDGALWINKKISKTHNGILLTYAVWFVVGLILMLMFFM
ncbi:MAG TPA: proton-conducting transporter membrane subunit [Balneolales bacterium]|nr:proton-conducting transporter membrane subunit [Balneolales bacterium]